MRPIANFTLHAMLAAAIAALATASAAAQSPPTLRIVTETPGLPSGAGGRGEHIEIESFQWGTTQQARTFVKSWSTSGDADDRPAAGRAGKDMTLKGSTIGQNAKDGRKGGNVEFEWKVEEGESAPVGGSEKQTIGANRTPTARSDNKLQEVRARAVADTPSGERQHRPVTIRKEWDAGTPQLARPLGKGSVWIRVATPWAGCRVGARYPSLELTEGTKRYMLQDASVASCGRSAADDRPTEEVAFYYNRIAFNYASTPDGK